MNDRGELAWQTSTKSSGANCIEVAADDERVHVRDSKNPSGAVLTFGRRAFQDFIVHLNRGTLGR
jgi:hypothetical protein